MTEEYINKHIETLLGVGTIDTTKEEVVDQLLDVYLKNCPQKLYKYRTCSRRNFKTLREGKIFMPYAKEFKDIFDNTVKFDLQEEADEIKKYLYDKIDEFILVSINRQLASIGLQINCTIEEVKEIREKYFTNEGVFLADVYEKNPVVGDKTIVFNAIQRCSEILSNMKEDFEKTLNNTANNIIASGRKPREENIVYCISEDGNCPVMWENYAENYQGFCIEYDFSCWREKPINSKILLLYLLPVLYSKEKPRQDLLPAIQIAIEQYITQQKQEMPKQQIIDYNKQLLQKSTDYDYEKEWRIALLYRGEQLVEFPFVSAIYMGKDIAENNIKHLQVIAKKFNVPLYKQDINYYNNRYEYKLYS